MFFPDINKSSEKLFTVNSFGSLKAGHNVPDGCFSKMKNLTGDRFPLMSIRDRRAVYSSAYPLRFGGESVTAVLNTPHGILVCTETSVYIGGVKIEGVSLGRDVKNRTAVLFGRNVFISPDSIYIKLGGGEIGVTYCNYLTQLKSADAVFCTEDGTDIFPDYTGDVPKSPPMASTIVLSDGQKMYFYVYLGDKWERQFEVFFRLSCSTKISGFSENETIHVKSTGGLFDDGYYTVKKVFEDSLVLSGVLRSAGTVSEVTLSKNIPLMDYTVEHNNRLWGCRYGKNQNGEFVNEIYASKLGNPEEWYCFNGISTDSYAVSLGCSGEFTGAAKVGNEVIFFKENYLIRVMGDSPSDFTVSTVPGRGAQKGQYRSIVNLGERLFYKGTDGITVYDGTLPFVISERDAFTGYSDSVAASYKGKYYIVLTSPEGDRAIYIYDTENSLWHREDDRFNTRAVFVKDGNLFHLGEGEDGNYTLFAHSYKGLTEANKAVPLLGEVAFTPEAEEPSEWYCETGKLCRDITSYNKKIRAVRFSVTLGDASFVKISVRTDNSEAFREIFYLDKKTDGIFSAAVPLVPCKFFTLRLEGRGDFILHSFEVTLSYTGEVTDID